MLRTLQYEREAFEECTLIISLNLYNYTVYLKYKCFICIYSLFSVIVYDISSLRLLAES